jgi:hypothetical protein
VLLGFPFDFLSSKYIQSDLASFGRVLT